MGPGDGQLDMFGVLHWCEALTECIWLWKGQGDVMTCLVTGTLIYIRFLVGLSHWQKAWVYGEIRDDVVTCLLRGNLTCIGFLIGLSC